MSELELQIDRIVNIESQNSLSLGWSVLVIFMLKQTFI